MEVQQIKDQVADKALVFQDKVKNIFDKKEKLDDFQQGDSVLKWDTRHQDKGKHGKFEHLWKGPYQISEDRGNNSYNPHEINGDPFSVGSMNGQFLKHYLAS